MIVDLFGTIFLYNFQAGGGESPLCFHESNAGIKEESPVFFLKAQAQWRVPVGKHPQDWDSYSVQ